jgi:ATP-dependent RNA helicase DHX8/PRP22
MNGKTVNHGSLTPIVLQFLSSRDGIMLMKSVQQQMGTCILFDRQNLTIRIFGPENQAALTEHKLVASLLAFRDKQQTDICL